MYTPPHIRGNIFPRQAGFIRVDTLGFLKQSPHSGPVDLIRRESIWLRCDLKWDLPITRCALGINREKSGQAHAHFAAHLIQIAF